MGGDVMKDISRKGVVLLFCLVISCGCSQPVETSLLRSIQDIATETPPQVPSGLIGNALSMSSIELSWEDNSDNEQDFEIQRHQSVDGQWKTIAITDPDINSFTDSGLETATEYGYHVRARNFAGFSQWSEEARISTLGYPTYEVSYHPNGATIGSVPSDSNRYETGEFVTVLDEGDLEQLGYAFTGWNTLQSGLGSQFASGDNFSMPNHDVNLYAMWDAYEIGDRGPGGGVIFYDKNFYSSGWRFLEVAPEEFESSEPWANSTYAGTFITLWDDVPNQGSPGDGYTNTFLIYNYMGDDGFMTVGPYAAWVAWRFSYGGYNDWFLPAQYTLIELRNKRDVIGSFQSVSYWSSTQTGASKAYALDFDPGYTGLCVSQEKIENHIVRPVRRF
jgi:uncharacterized repeat protein (TIGR02543 family)